MIRSKMAMGHNLWLHFGVDEHPFATYFDAHSQIHGSPRIPRRIPREDRFAPGHRGTADQQIEVLNRDFGGLDALGEAAYDFLWCVLGLKCGRFQKMRLFP